MDLTSSVPLWIPFFLCPLCASRACRVQCVSTKVQRQWAPQRLWIERLASVKGHEMPHLLVIITIYLFSTSIGSSGRWYQSIKAKHVKRISNGDSGILALKKHPNVWNYGRLILLKHNSSPWLDPQNTEQSNALCVSFQEVRTKNLRAPEKIGGEFLNQMQTKILRKCNWMPS